MPTSRHAGAITADCTETMIGEVRIDINVDDPAAVDQQAIDDVDRLIDDIEALRGTALASFAGVILDDASTPAEFWQFHHDEVDPSIGRDKFVASLHLVRVGFYPNGAPWMFAVLDFKVHGPPTDQILVANFARDRSLQSVAWES